MKAQQLSKTVEEEGSGITAKAPFSSRVRWLVSGAIALTYLAVGLSSSQAGEGPNALIASIHGGAVLVSFQTSTGTVAGSAGIQDSEDNYHQVLLFSSSFTSDLGGQQSILVQGSGSGTASTDPCEEFSILVQGSGSGTASVGDGCAFDNPNAWGFAEVEQVENGVLLVIHRVVDGSASVYASVLLAL